jgi:uncharacterized protein
MPKYFHYHTPEVIFDGELEKERCQGNTVDGHQCKRNVIIGLNFCHTHLRTQHYLEIKKSTIPHSGNGVFAISSKGNNSIVFKPDQFICMYNGEIIDKEELIRRYGETTAPYAVQLNKGKIEDASLERGIGSMFNHQPISKCNARLSISKDNRVKIIATKRIKSGQEIFINYGREYRFEEDNVKTSTNNRKKTV